MYLEDEKVILKEYEEDHFSKTVEWLNQLEIRQNFGIKNNITLDQHKQWFSNLENTFIKAIYDKQNSLYVGNILLQLNDSNQSAFFQIYLGEVSAMGRGIATSTLYIILDYVFLHMQYNRVWLKVFPHNQKAIKLYEKTGFVLEGIERESYRDKDSFRNQMVFSILKRDWIVNEKEVKNK
ncbi:hypothetical protein AM499_11260 [Bacillus sp. FJAT-22090]|uniref:GNAT family N-acetyltransferase n=1 Tax=Bacillus sp. FJAT-22090 TaxID=1581038 RepID=UPI0006B06210|nr:GNAT family protein [Bacillus sp. FJAT-22090]ALC86343.1 hypothetical protein AM499_11260 [Bacillus sp. FJAT-22090]